MDENQTVIQYFKGRHSCIQLHMKQRAVQGSYSGGGSTEALGARANG